MSARSQAARGGYRLKPVRRHGGSRGSRIHWDKLGRVVLVFVLFAILVSYVNPVVNFVDAWRDAGAERLELRELKRQNQALRAKAGSLEGAAAAEGAARALGMVATDEAPYTIKR